MSYESSPESQSKFSAEIDVSGPPNSDYSGGAIIGGALDGIEVISRSEGGI